MTVRDNEQVNKERFNSDYKDVIVICDHYADNNSSLLRTNFKHLSKWPVMHVQDGFEKPEYQRDGRSDGYGFFRCQPHNKPECKYCVCSL